VDSGQISRREDSETRVIKRLWIKRNLNVLLRHATYHKEHQNDMRGNKRTVMWQVGDEAGENKVETS